MCTGAGLHCSSGSSLSCIVRKKVGRNFLDGYMYRGGTTLVVKFLLGSAGRKVDNAVNNKGLCAWSAREALLIIQIAYSSLYTTDVLRPKVKFYFFFSGCTKYRHTCIRVPEFFK